MGEQQEAYLRITALSVQRQLPDIHSCYSGKPNLERTARSKGNKLEEILNEWETYSTDL
jgi:hypothetical protein